MTRRRPAPEPEDPEVARLRVILERQCAEQGIPVTLDDPATLEAIATILHRADDDERAAS